MTAEVWDDAKDGCTAYRVDMEAYCGSNSGRDVEAAEVWDAYNFHRGGNRRGEAPEVEEAYSRRVDSRGRDGCCRRVGSRYRDVNCCRRVGSRCRDASCCCRVDSRCRDANCCRRVGSRYRDASCCRRVDSRYQVGCCCRRVGSRYSDVNCCRYDCLSRSFRPYCRDGSAVRMLSEDVYCCCCARGFGRSNTQGSWIVIRPIRVLLSVSSVYCVNGGF